MNRGFSHYLKIVAAAHGMVVVGLFLVSGWRSCASRTREVTFPVALHVEVASPVVADEPVAPPPPVRAREPEPRVEPKPEPKPEPEPRPKRAVEVSDAKVTRTVERPPSPRYSAEDIRKMERLLASKPVAGDAVPASEDRAGLWRVRDVLYRAWENRPSAEEAGGAVAEVAIGLRSGGRVISRNLVKPSGNPVLDESVMRAVASVSVIPGLSDAFIARHQHVITVAFKLE